MHWVLSIVAAVHGLLHLIGFKKRRAWLVPAVLWLLTAVTSLTFSGSAWIPGLLALISSQVLLVGAWREARFGTLVNVLLAVLLVLTFTLEGPLSLDAEFARATANATSTPGPGVTEEDLTSLPAPVQRYLRLAGAVGKPRVTRTHATWTGRIRGGVDQPWMSFTAEQVNTWGVTPERYFLMHATMNGLPVRVFHRFASEGAGFRVRPLGLFNLVDASGPQLTRAETVTILNDLVLLAPSRLLDPTIRFEEIDAHAARVHFTRASETVSAELRFGDAGWLVDFVSDDRSQASADGKEFKPLRWSTPVNEPTTYGGWRLARRGDAVWHEPGGAWTYGEFELQDITND